MKKKLIYRKKDLYNLKSNLFYLFKKKKAKDLIFSKRKNYFKIIKIFKIIFFYNLFFKNYYFKTDSDTKSKVKFFDRFFFQYNIIKNYWYIYLNIYNFVYEKINFKISYIFNIFFFKYFVKNILRIENLKLKKSFSLILNFNISNIFKYHEKKMDKLLYVSFKKKRKFLKIELYINKRFRNIMKNIIKIKFFHIIFNTNKYQMFSTLVKYLIKIFNFRIKKQFVYYWSRFYKYSLKKLITNVEVELIKYIRIIFKQYNLFYSLINLKGTKKKIFFFFYFFFNRYKNKFLKMRKVFKYFFNVNKLLKSNFFKKISFNLFFIKKKNLMLSLYSYKSNLKKIKFLTKIKALIFIKNFIFLFLLQTFILWFNYYYLVQFKMSIIRNTDYTYFKFSNINIKNIPLVLILIKTYNWNRLSFLNCNYFFYNNIFFNESSEIGKRKKFW